MYAGELHPADAPAKITDGAMLECTTAVALSAEDWPGARVDDAGLTVTVTAGAPWACRSASTELIRKLSVAPLAIDPPTVTPQLPSGSSRALLVNDTLRLPVGHAAGWLLGGAASGAGFTGAVAAGMLRAGGATGGVVVDGAAVVAGLVPTVVLLPPAEVLGEEPGARAVPRSGAVGAVPTALLAPNLTLGVDCLAPPVPIPNAIPATAAAATTPPTANRRRRWRWRTGGGPFDPAPAPTGRADRRRGGVRGGGVDTTGGAPFAAGAAASVSLRAGRTGKTGVVCVVCSTTVPGLGVATGSGATFRSS